VEPSYGRFGFIEAEKGEDSINVNKEQRRSRRFLHSDQTLVQLPQDGGVGDR
jgi:hypothetical protein